jgi:hypothetical protein
MCINFLWLNLYQAMKQLQEELLLNSQHGMLTAEGKESLHDEEIVDIANVMVASIAGGAWAAMDEFGVGSLSYRQNPALKDYIGSPAWNPARGSDMVIRSRPDTPGQINIFGEPVSGRGKGGVDLEKLGIVEPRPPSHAIETAMRWMKHSRMREVLQNIINNFPFGSFVIVDGR